MCPDPDSPREAWGVLNPACARDRDGKLYLFPRVVAEGNFSCIGKASVVFEDGAPVGVERLGIVLEPEERWEQNARSAGVEDPRITFVSALDLYLMTYSAYGPLGSRIGLAWSKGLQEWQRLGPAWFAYDPALKADLNLYPNKDAVLLPEPVRGPDGQPCLAMLHRPMWDQSWILANDGLPVPTSVPAGISDPRPGIWVSFTPIAEVERDLRLLPRFGHHRAVALPEHPWEGLKIGAGPPPIKTDAGWLLIYHGVEGRLVPGRDHQPAVCYSAGLMLLDLEDVTRVQARSIAPLLEPETKDEREGIVDNVVFPTALDPDTDGGADVYYGMADFKIGVARLRRIDQP